ncbi:MAG TPA: protein YgfX [Usitatibacter sp.]|nr:protein YgfX [Usitatibacter sp.]
MECVRCELQYSRLAAGSILAAALATALVAAMLPIAAPWRLAALAAIAAAALRAWRRIRAVRAVQLHRDGAIELVLRDGRSGQGRVRPGSFVAPWLVLVRWRPEGARFDRTLALLPDMAGREALRKVRVILRWA